MEELIKKYHKLFNSVAGFEYDINIALQKEREDAYERGYNAGVRKERAYQSNILTMKDQTRNLHPTPEARFAMFHWHKEYAAQKGGSMDFYDGLTKDQKDYCKRAVEAIRAS